MGDEIDEVVEKATGSSYDCTMYGTGQISNAQIIEHLEQGHVASVKVWGRGRGGSSRFTGSQHFMALIDYYDNQIFVGNAYSNSSHGKWGWYSAGELLTSVMSTVICIPKL